MEIIRIFPTCIGQPSINRPMTKKELDCIYKSMDNTDLILGSKNSKNQKVLESKQLTDIKTFVEDQIKDYVDNVIKANTNNVYINKSWTEIPSKEYPRRNSKNSILSAIYIVNSNPEVDKLFFYNDYNWFDPQISFTPTSYDEDNSTSWWLPTLAGDLFIFPSEMSFSLESKSEEFCVIHVRTWVDGEIDGPLL
jgi:hypothetical protein